MSVSPLFFTILVFHPEALASLNYIPERKIMTRDEEGKFTTERQPKTLQQWGELRKSNPRQYYSPQAQKLMLEDLQTLGEDFYKRERSDKDL